MTPMSLNDFPEEVPVAQRRWIRLVSLLVAGPPDPLEIVLGALKLAFGFWLLMPFSLFATSPNLYRYVAEIPEWAWGSVYFGLGVLQWTSYYREINKLRYFVGVTAAMVWDFYGYEIWRADHRTVSLIFLSIIAGGQMLACIWLYDKAFPKHTSTQGAGHDKD